MTSPAVAEVLALLEPAGPPARAAVLDTVAAKLQPISVPDAIALGFSFAGPGGDSGERPVLARPDAGLAHGALSLMLSPRRGHRALLWQGYDDDAFRLWIDARELALPPPRDAMSPIEPPGGWADERFFELQFVVPEHPAQDWSRVPGRGQVRGLLICDALARREWAVCPEDHETWTFPMLGVGDGCLRLYADAAASESRRPAREWPIDG